MSPRLLVPWAAAAVCLAATGGYLLLRDDGLNEIVDELPTDAHGRPLDERTLARRRLDDRRAQAHNLGFADRDRAHDPAGVPDEDYGSGEVDRKAAMAGFEHAMTELEALAAERERLEQPQWRELYRTANDAFAALSMHLDASEPGDAEELENAHRRLKSALRRVRVHGRKFAPY